MAIFNHNLVKRHPIVFCVDVSPTMEKDLEDINVVIDTFIKELQKDAKARTSAEVAFVTFSTNIEMETEFESIGTLKTPMFSLVRNGGTQVAQAVLKSIDKIEQRRKQLEKSEITCHAPLLILITCGNPDNNDDLALLNAAKSRINEYCSPNTCEEKLIFPFVFFIKCADYNDEIISYIDDYTNYPIFEINKDKSCNTPLDDAISRIIKYFRHCDFKKCRYCDDRCGKWCPIYIYRDKKFRKEIEQDMAELLKDLSGN
jgi:hypothetical protein